MIAVYKKKKKVGSFKNVFLPALLALFLLLIVGFLAWTDIKIKQRREDFLSRIGELKKEVQILEKKNEELKAKISQSGSKEYLEEVAREQFNLKAPGEEVVVVSKEKKEEEIKEEEKQPQELKSWWEWLKEKISLY